MQIDNAKQREILAAIMRHCDWHAVQEETDLGFDWDSGQDFVLKHYINSDDPHIPLMEAWNDEPFGVDYATAAVITVQKKD